MRYYEIISHLNEVRMGASDLRKFVASDLAQGIRIGFEAELCFNNLGGSEDSDGDGQMRPNYDENPGPRSIQRVCDFFSDGDGRNSRGTIGTLKERMTDDYEEWRDERQLKYWEDHAEGLVRKYIDDHEFDFDKHVNDYLVDEIGLDEKEVKTVLDAKEQAEDITSSKQLRLFAEDNEPYATYRQALDYANKILDSKVYEALNEENSLYQLAKTDWIQYSIDEDDYSEEKWFDSIDVYSMTDITSQYDMVSWPHWDYEDDLPGNEYDYDNASQLAKQLERELGVTATASRRYHSTKRTEDLWILEPDGSLEADDNDMPVEIISPPMPIVQGIEKMRQFFAWAKDEGAYSNRSTGLHVGVSLPDVGGQVDYLKLALFLGDEYVLKTFERISNTYCTSVLAKINAEAKRYAPKDRIMTMVDQMRNGLIELASTTLRIPESYGHTYSINPRNSYVEFRSMGNRMYLDNIDTVINTVQRYAMAMKIASDPNAYREEYAKKLSNVIGLGTETKYYDPNDPANAKQPTVFIDKPKYAKKQTNVPGLGIKTQYYDPNDPANAKQPTVFIDKPKRGYRQVTTASEAKRTVINYFSQYFAGVIPRQALMSFVNQSRLERQVKKEKDSLQKYWYKVTYRGSTSGYSVEVVATDEDEAIEKARQETGPVWRSIPASSFDVTPIKLYTDTNT